MEAEAHVLIRMGGVYSGIWSKVRKYSGMGPNDNGVRILKVDRKGMWLRSGFNICRRMIKAPYYPKNPKGSNDAWSAD